MSATAATSVRLSDWKVVKGGLIVGIGLMTGQALGFVRHATAAYLLGLGPGADALAVAMVPVDLLWAVLSTAVVFGFGPMLAASAAGPVASRFRACATALLRPVLVLTGVALLLAWPAVRMLGPGLSASTSATAVDLFRITALALPALAGCALFTAFLYSERRFLVPAFHQGIVNVVTILIALEFHRHWGAAAFATGYVAGAWLQFGIICWYAQPLLSGVRSQREPPRLWEMFAGPFPVLCYAVIINLNAVVTRAFASIFGEGATAGYEYSLRLLNVPLSLLVVPLSSSLLSEISAHRGGAYKAIRRAAIVTLLAAAGVVAFVLLSAPAMVSVLFERGRFDVHSTATVSAILGGFFPALIVLSVFEILSRSFFALGRPKAPLLAAGVGLIVNAAACSEFPIQTIAGLGIPPVLGFTASALIVAVQLRRLRTAEPV